MSTVSSADDRITDYFYRQQQQQQQLPQHAQLANLGISENCAFILLQNICTNYQLSIIF